MLSLSRQFCLRLATAFGAEVRCATTSGAKPTFTPSTMKKTPTSRKPRPPRLAALDMALQLDETAYLRELARVQERLRRIQRAYLKSGNSAAVVFEGWDAAGKGGTIRCMSAVLDPRGFKVWPISAPRKYYLERHYLTRFFERLPPRGAISVFDRSWYGRVLVERVEGLASQKDWRRAYREINEFERQISDDKTTVVKLFLMIDKEEQLLRFKSREADPYKKWKISDEDWRNRNSWDEHLAAAQDMFDLTSTKAAPWHLVAANYKWFARLEVMRTVVRALEALDLPK
jgi:polyphosphate kinase 2 (PPK2 family)